MQETSLVLAQKIARTIAAEIGARTTQVQAAVALLDDGATVPFVARYRKEATGGLDDSQLRNLETRLVYLRELEDRRKTILASIDEQGKLTPELAADIEAADSKSRLEDLYLPYRPKRRTKAQIAREAGLEPLADALAARPSETPEALAEPYVDADKGISDAKAALDGARAILIERWGESAPLIGDLREWLWSCGVIRSRVVEGKETEGAKYADYFDHAEPIAKIPSHRLLALLRARREKILELDLEPGTDADAGNARAQARIARHAQLELGDGPADAWLQAACRLAWHGKIHVHLALDLFNRAREKAEEQAIAVFGENLKDLLLAAPAGARPVMGLDPGLRTGVKVAVVDRTGKLVAAETIHPHEPKRKWEESLKTLAELCREHAVELVAIGNGTASRETDRLVADLIKRHPDLGLVKLLVNEAGASVYSASELAAREFPDLDVSLRGAASIARRLQDPLAELVKIEPKSIGVGQYQHDVDQTRLSRALDARVEDCVNAVGVHVNTASAALLSRVAGLSAGVADNIIGHRDEIGPFKRRTDLLAVSRLGAKTFEQCAGFLRIGDGDEPLDASAVHPEAYPVVARIVERTKRGVKDLIGDAAFLRTLDPETFVDERFGAPTVRDILKELEKPGRDPRPELKTARFADGVEKLEDLKPGMVLEGVVSNVAAFGAFVDVGVHQDGLVHISALSDKFVKDPREVVKAGDIVKVKVLDVDTNRRRISLTLRLNDDPGAERERGAARGRRAGTDDRAGEGKRPSRERRSSEDGRPHGDRRTSEGGRPSADRSARKEGGRPGNDRRNDARRNRGEHGRAGAFNTAMAEAFARARKDGD